MQQQPPQMIPMMPMYPGASISTEQIQKCLDDNKRLILAIMDNQNLGRVAECAQYQAQLQKNLMYLAAVADSQPQIQATTVPPNMVSHAAMQPGAYFTHSQAALMAQQPGIFPQKMAFQLNSPPNQLQDPLQQLHQQHQQTLPGQIGAGGHACANSAASHDDGGAAEGK